MRVLASYLGGAWQPGQGPLVPLVNPTTEEVIAQVHSQGQELGAAYALARGAGRAALAELTFAQRGELLQSLAKAIHGAREELIALAVQNGGNTRGDAKFDLDGASATLAYYAGLGAELGARAGSSRLLADGEALQVGRTARMGGQHVWITRPGVAVHINAFNFPAWGLAEKLGCALLAGVPVISKPATATALVAHRLMELFAPLVPAGVLQLLCGPAGDLLDHLGPGDALAFTGSSATAQTLRGHKNVIAHSVRLNIEADSLNAAVLGPDVDLGSETGQLFLLDVVRDMTQKTGQKCTAIRRVLVPADKHDDVAAALSERLAAIVVGDPTREDVRMGPVATAAQLRDVRAGIARLAAETASVYGGTGEIAPRGVPEGKGFFVGPVLRSCPDPRTSSALNDHEVFGPVSTLAPYDGAAATAVQIVARGYGGLVTSVYSDDRDWVTQVVAGAAPWHGRLFLGSSKMAAQSPGPGTVLPQLLHGGPGRAGGGEELGGERGVHFYMQRVALEGDASVLKGLLGG
jgi:oxepin-CoA hydrolase/3-oxo-5,6-dehydrosuberyl-CoA semialdehyde dehydrogenase